LIQKGSSAIDLWNMACRMSGTFIQFDTKSGGILLRTVLTSVPTLQKKIKALTVSKFPKIDFPSLLHRIPFGPQQGKIAVVSIFSLCWLSIVLVRSQVARDPAALNASSLLGLATALQQGAISCLDFQRIFGAEETIVAWVAP